jgi:predicted phosphodiesterase
MTTLVVSDLHLSANSNGDVARTAALREPLLAAVADVDELLLLGDIIEMRERPVWDALELARPFFHDIGEALGDKRVTLVPGNHDHALAGPWLEARRRAGRPLSLTERIAPADASPMAARIAEWIGPRAGFELAYPAVWPREDVFALHGHHLDRHNTVPSFEVLAQRLVERWGGRGRAPGPDGYEDVFGIVYRASYAAAQRSEGGRPDGVIRVDASHTAWELLSGTDRPLLVKALTTVAIPSAVALLWLMGLGPIGTEISGRTLRTAALAALGEVLEDLRVRPDHVIFGHTHRAGPRDRDDAAEWVTPGGALIHNDGCWVHDPTFLGPGGAAVNPYWPGRALRVGADGPPEQLGLLDHLDAEEILALIARDRA